MIEAQEFAATPRGQLLRQSDTDKVAPVTFYNEDGDQYKASSPGEINRLRLSRGYFSTPEAAANPLQADDHRFHPGESGVTVDDVLRYIDEHPEDAARVLEEERAGKHRTTILDLFDET